ncbi:MAG: hypothetical protein FJ004_11385 [Chloroflexi bacterium]|nr:hypothetical protein [Chloroflexota bacterium]
MGDTFITDMTHFESIQPGPSHQPARKIARFFGAIVSAASVSPTDRLIDAALFCRRRPGRIQCPGHLQIYRDGVSGIITWHCSRCDDQGEISNWEGTPWNLGKWAIERQSEQQFHELILTEDELQELKRSLILSRECECLLYRAIIAHGGIVIRATLEEFEELEENIAADANHEEKRRRQRILDRIYERIETLFDQEHYYGSDFEEWMQDNQQELSQEIESFVNEMDEKMKQSQGFPSKAKNSISADVVEKTWQRVAKFSPQNVQKLIKRMAKEQPVVLAYLMAVDNDIFNQSEREGLLFLGMVVWQIMLQGTRPLPKVTEKILDEAEARNLKMAEYLRDETEAGFEETTRKIIGSYKQPEVLRYVVEAIMEDTEESSPIREENKGIMLLDLKTVIDCFDA